MIPAQAVEAAARKLYSLEDCTEPKLLAYFFDIAREALEAAAPHMQPDRKSLAEVLANHQIKTGNRGMTPRCTCGWLGQVFGNDFREDFIVHQSDMLTVALRPTK